MKGFQVNVNEAYYANLKASFQSTLDSNYWKNKNNFVFIFE